MDNPNASPRIRRCHSRTSRLHRRTAAFLSRKLAWHKNPYVGSFRHAPPSTFGSIKACIERSDGTGHFYLTLSPQENMRNSPYVGWFRHAPPTKMKMSKEDLRDLAMLEKSRSLIISHIPMRDHRPKLSEMINGRLRGGGTDDLRLFHRVLAGEESLLTKLGTWILYPLAQDAESLYKACYYDRKLKLLTEDAREDDDDCDSDSDSEDENDLYEEDDEDSVELSDADGPLMHRSKRTFPSSPVAKPMDLSISEIAEAYYAHQELDESPFSLTEGDRLDYVITQADIARMARNAARHLDVESILNLPTMTYRHPTKTIGNVRDSRDPDDEGFSFIMVPEKVDKSIDQSSADSVMDTQCVICLEAFREGDRLRVLPCNHSFHVGCIDRWLSGSHSHSECFTSGCPTCKKSPSTNHFAITCASKRETPCENDGSVPSWAFIQLGSHMAQSSMD